MATIDYSMLKILVETQIATASASVIEAKFYPGDTVPNNLDRWIKVLPIDMRSLPDDREDDGAGGGGLDSASFVVTVNCFASQFAMKSTNAALANVLAEVKKTLHKKTMRDVSSTHQVDIFEAEIVADGEPDRGGQRRISTGAVIATGIVYRTAGVTLATHV